MKNKSIFLIFTLIISSIASFSQPGTLDGDFDANGSVITNVSSVFERANSVVVQPDGKIVVTGESGDQTNYATVRYQPDGSIDNSFGTNGIVLTNLGFQDNARSIVLQSDGKIIVGGTSTGFIAIEAFAMVRYNQNGTIDNTFSTVNSDGFFLGPLGDCADIAIQSDGKIVAVGTAANFSDDFVIARYNSDGSMDTSFGVNGVVTTDFGGADDGAYTVAIQSDDNIVVAGWSNSGSDYNVAVARYTSTGSLDNSFSVNGMVTTDFDGFVDIATSVFILPNGKIVTTGRTRDNSNVDNFGLVRYNSDGTLDNSFGTNGKVRTEEGSITLSAVLQPDGKIIIVGLNDFVLARYKEDGTLDDSFGLGGIATPVIGTGSNQARSCTLQPDGKIVVVGYARLDPSDIDYVVARFLTGLNLDIISFSKQDHGLLIYPNPLQENAVIEYTLTNNETISIDLYDISGRLVQSFIKSEKRNKGMHKELLAIDAAIPSGNYILSLSNGEGKSSVQVIK